MARSRKRRSQRYSSIFPTLHAKFKSYRAMQRFLKDFGNHETLKKALGHVIRSENVVIWEFKFENLVKEAMLFVKNFASVHFEEGRDEKRYTSYPEGGDRYERGRYFTL